MNVDVDMDVRGKVCPMPLIALAKEIRRLPRGSVVRIVGDDPIFEETVQDFCREGSHAIVETRRDGKVVDIAFTVGTAEGESE